MSRREHWGALLAYGAAALALTWPLLAYWATHVPGDGIDDPALAWNLWWVRHRWVDQAAADLFLSGWMFHPIRINLGFYTLTPLNGLLSVPLQGSLGLVPAANLVLLSSFVLGGYGAFLLARAVWQAELARLPRTHAWWVAWLAGFFYAFASAKLFYIALGQFNIASSHWLPFAALYLWRIPNAHGMGPRLAAGAMAGLFLTLQAWSELTYASFLILLALLMVGWALATGPRRSWRATFELMAGFATTAGVFVVGIAPFLAAMLPDLRREGDFFASGGGFADVFSADLLGFLVPTRLHPLVGEWVASLPFANDKGQHLYVGYTLTALIVLVLPILAHGGRLHRRVGFWVVALLFFGWLSLGPTLRWAGHDLGIPGPFEWISRLPFFSGNRYPSRYSVMVLLAAALLAAAALSRLVLRLPGRRTALLLATVGVLFVAEHVSAPLPLNDFRIPAVYARLGGTPGDFTVLEFPTGWRNGARVLGRADVLIMMQQWYQTEHGKRRLGGNTSRNPIYKFQYFTEEPLIGDWIALMNADREHLAPVVEQAYPAMLRRARAEAPALLGFLGVRYVTLHVERSPELLRRYVEEALPVTLVETWQGADWTGAPSTIRLYAVVPPQSPPSSMVDMAVDMADPIQARRHLGEGWAALAQPGLGRYATRAEAVLLVALPPERVVLRLTYAAEVRVAYTVDGLELGSGAGAVHTLVVPADLARAPVSRVMLRFVDAGMAAGQTAVAPSPIGRTGAALSPGVSLVVRSAGEEVGDFAHIFVGGLDVAAGGRGYNLAALSPHGRVLEAATFDTFAEGGSAAMAAWLKQWPAGTVVAGAVADEASLRLEQDAVDALARLGVAADLRGRFRWSHAFVGVVEAGPGSALEAVSLLAPASVWLGSPADGPLLYGPLLTLEQSLPTE